MEHEIETTLQGELTGVANVLSINETRPWDLANSTMLSRSGTRISGLEIVST